MCRTNILGDVIAIYNTEGDLQCKYNYDAWGNHRIGNARNELICDSATGVIATGYESHIAILNPIRYRGYYYDTETQLFYCNSRYYSPEICRWISPDSIEYLDPENINGLNLYAYANNNPIMYYDPSGHSAILIGLIIGALIGFGTAAYIDYRDDGQIFNGSVAWYDYLGATVLGGTIGAGLGAFAGMSFSASIPIFGWINSGGALMFGVTGSIAITVTGAEVLGVAGLLGGIYMFAKTSRQPGKVTSSDKPSWVNESMVDPNKSAQQNAKDILDWKYGPGNWPKGPGTEYNKIVKWIERYLRYYRGW